jgi:hypothetical protein
VSGYDQLPKHQLVPKSHPPRVRTVVEGKPSDQQYDSDTTECYSWPQSSPIAPREPLRDLNMPPPSSSCMPSSPIRAKRSQRSSQHASQPPLRPDGSEGGGEVDTKIDDETKVDDSLVVNDESNAEEEEEEEPEEPEEPEKEDEEDEEEKKEEKEVEAAEEEEEDPEEPEEPEKENEEDEEEKKEEKEVEAEEAEEAEDGESESDSDLEVSTQVMKEMLESPVEDKPPVSDAVSEARDSPPITDALETTNESIIEDGPKVADKVSQFRKTSRESTASVSRQSRRSSKRAADGTSEASSASTSAKPATRASNGIFMRIRASTEPVCSPAS